MRIEENETGSRICVDLKIDKSISEKAGAPRRAQVIYTLSENGLTMELSWFGKDACRTPEALFLHFYPEAQRFSMSKLGTEIDYKSTVSMGGRNIHAVEKCRIENAAGDFELINLHSPIVSVGQGKILEYDNKIESLEKDGISFVLYNNVWGTNFPLWYEDNARFALFRTQNLLFCLIYAATKRMSIGSGTDIVQPKLY